MTQGQVPGGETRPGDLLYVGCGYEPLPPWLAAHGLRETRLDIDPACRPDVVASMTDMGEIGPFDLVFSCHSLEHLAPHDVAVALGEFRRVLRPGGQAAIVVPDLEDVRPTEDVLYVSAAGPISGLDLFYGFRPALRAQPYMAHRTGFIAQTLGAALTAAGFATVKTERLPDYNLMGLATA